MKFYAKPERNILWNWRNHHDNFDNWNSKYQPFNAMNFGPKKDLVGLMAGKPEKTGFGSASPITQLATAPGIYLCPLRTAAMPRVTRLASLTTAGGFRSPTARESSGKGSIPVIFMGRCIRAAITRYRTATVLMEPIDPNSEMFSRQLLWRSDDMLKYKPDLIYFDYGLRRVGVCRDQPN